jgi:carboxyl-terminal processing protease
MVRATWHGHATDRPPLSVRPGTPASGRAEMISILEQRYYRAVDPASLEAAPAEQLPSLLDDPYTHFLSADEYHHFMTDERGSTVGIGIDFLARRGELTVTRVFPNSPAAVAGLRPGDRITSVDGRALFGRTTDGSTALLRGANGTTSELQLVRLGEVLGAHVTRRTASTWMVDAELRPTGAHRIGYIALLDFSEGTGALVREAAAELVAKGADRLVLDLRGNPGGWAKEAVAVASVFLPSDSPVLTERSVQFEDTVYTTHAEPVTTDIPMVVLTDRDTASSAEIVSGALHDAGRATLMGARTFGKGRIQDVAVLSTGGAFKFTIAEYLTPTGFALDRVGISPDIATAPTLFHGVDVAYLEAVAHLTS